VKPATLQVCKKFFNDDVDSISPLGNGLINDTFLASVSNKSFVLQRINTQVFPEPSQIMENLNLLNQHISQKHPSVVKLKVPKLIKTIDQNHFYLDKQNSFWRALEFIENTESKELICHQNEAEQVGFALGHFHCLFCDIHVDLFHDTLPGFHIAPLYFQHYQQIKKQYPDINNCQKIQFCENFINSNQSLIDVLETAKKNKLLSERIIHGDPKLNNFLFDKQTHKIISLIDLDTVKPGLVHYDIADCLRSCCHNNQSNHFQLDTCEIILNSYLKETADFFTEQDYDFLYPAIQLIPFELGLRFYTDFLQGNQYFKVDFPEHNLNRALAQFKLCESITNQKTQIKQLISDFKKPVKK
jgi:thiamine kinase-like enzyme